MLISCEPYGMHGGIRMGLPSPGWILEIGTVLMWTESELVLKSRRVVPGRLLDVGFEFLFPEWPAAARDLVARWRENSRRYAEPQCLPECSVAEVR